MISDGNSNAPYTRSMTLAKPCSQEKLLKQKRQPRQCSVASNMLLPSRLNLHRLTNWLLPITVIFLAVAVRTISAISEDFLKKVFSKYIRMNQHPANKRVPMTFPFHFELKVEAKVGINPVYSTIFLQGICVLIITLEFPRLHMNKGGD